MGKVTDINKFKSSKKEANPKTEGDYLCVILGEDKEGKPIVLIEQCEVEGSYEHTDRVVLNPDMLHTLIEELIAVSDMITTGTVH
jgi:hypothetical protein